MCWWARCRVRFWASIVLWRKRFLKKEEKHQAFAKDTVDAGDARFGPRRGGVPRQERGGDTGPAAISRKKFAQIKTNIRTINLVQFVWTLYFFINPICLFVHIANNLLLTVSSPNKERLIRHKGEKGWEAFKKNWPSKIFRKHNVRKMENIKWWRGIIGSKQNRNNIGSNYVLQIYLLKLFQRNIGPLNLCRHGKNEYVL